VPRARLRARVFHYTTFAPILSREKCEKNKKTFFPKTLDKMGVWVYTIRVLRVKANGKPKKNLKKVKKVLDKLLNLWYT